MTCLVCGQSITNQVQCLMQKHFQVKYTVSVWPTGCSPMYRQRPMYWEIARILCELRNENNTTTPPSIKATFEQQTTGSLYGHLASGQMLQISVQMTCISSQYSSLHKFLFYWRKMAHPFFDYCTYFSSLLNTNITGCFSLPVQQWQGEWGRVFPATFSFWGDARVKGCL